MIRNRHLSGFARVLALALCMLFLGTLSAGAAPLVNLSVFNQDYPSSALTPQTTIYGIGNGDLTADPNAAAWAFYQQGSEYVLKLLNGAVLAETHPNVSPAPAISADGDLTLLLDGSSQLTGYDGHVGIWLAGGDLTITSQNAGELTCAGPQAIVLSDGGLRIQSGTVNAVNAEQYETVAAYGGIDVSGTGVLKATNNNNSSSPIVIQSDGDVRISDQGRIEAKAIQPLATMSVGIQAQSLSMTGGSLLVQAGKVATAINGVDNALDLSGFTSGYTARTSDSSDGAGATETVDRYTPNTNTNYLEIIPRPIAPPAPSTLPQTGDTATPLLWTLLALAAIAGGAGVAFLGRKRGSATR